MDNQGLLSAPPSDAVPSPAPMAVPSPAGMPVPSPAAAPPAASAPSAASVAEAMPSAPPLESLRDTYSVGASGNFEDHGAAPSEGGWGGVHAGEQQVQGSFYSPQEVQVLQAQAVPVDTFQLGKGGAAPSAEPVPMAVPVAQTMTPVATAVPVLTTAVGMPIYAASDKSTAATEQDGSSGVKSSDPLLTSVPEILKFLDTYNTRPRVAARVHGYHRERRHRTVTRTDSEGNKRTEREEYWVTITDFEYKLDLTEFIFPFGFIQSATPGTAVPDLCEGYVKDTNLLKTLRMDKEISFDFSSLSAMIHGYIRSLGWRRGLSVSFPKANHTVRVWSRNKLSAMWENCCCNVLCHITIIPCIVMRCYRDCGGHQETGVKSVYRIDYHPLQIFEMIKPRLWCPGWSGADMAMELYRHLFW